MVGTTKRSCDLCISTLIVFQDTRNGNVELVAYVGGNSLSLVEHAIMKEQMSSTTKNNNTRLIKVAKSDYKAKNRIWNKGRTFDGNVMIEKEK